MIDVWLVIAACAVACYLWRGLGVAMSGRLSPRSPVILWVTCVAYAMLAGTFTRMIVLPAGGLAAAPLDHRLISCAAAFAVFLALRRNVIAGTTAGVAAIIALGYWARPLFTL